MIHFRDLAAQDEARLVRYLNNSHVVKYLTSRIPSPYTLEDANWWINTGSKDSAVTKVIEFDGVFCGVISVYRQQFEYSHSAEIGYWLAEEFWGKGIASAALAQFSEFILSTTDIIRLYASVFSANPVSMKVLEKAGYSCEGIFRKGANKNDKYYDVHLFALVNG
jgi:RimJ/RimL family protein N-acetyltransferase